MTNIRQIALTILLTTSLAACSTTSVVQEWHLDTPAGPKPDKIAVVVMLPDDLQRLSVERVLVEDIQKAGGIAVPSSEIRGMRSKLTRAKAETALRAAGVDAVVIAFLKGAMRGEELQRADYYLQHEGSGVYYDWYSPQFTEIYSIQEGSGFYDQERHIFVETTYYDMDTEKARWTMVTDSSALEYRDTAKAISGKIVARMKRDGSL
jgi:hypothetical protein